MVTRVVTNGRKRSAPRSAMGLRVAGGVLVLSAMIVAYRSGNSGKSGGDAQASLSSDLIEVVVPIAPIAIGAALRDQRFQKLVVSRRSVPRDVVTSEEQINSAVSTVGLPAGLPIAATNLSFSRNVSNPVSGRIPPGMRAITVKVDATSSVEGWAGSGSVVDVLLVEKNRTSVVAEKVRVLSAERSTSPVEGLSMPSVPSTVTLLVTQEQTLSINTAVPLGRIAFALRSSNDDSSWRDTSFSADRLSAGQIPTNRPAITGYISMGEGANAKRYALTNGKWLETSSAPDGFFAAGESR